MSRALVLLCAIALSSCSQPTTDGAPVYNGSEVQLIGPQVGNGIYKLCDNGRALYIFDGNQSGGITVVENAPECPQPQSPTRNVD